MTIATERHCRVSLNVREKENAYTLGVSKVALEAGEEVPSPVRHCGVSLNVREKMRALWGKSINRENQVALCSTGCRLRTN